MRAYPRLMPPSCCEPALAKCASLHMILVVGRVSFVLKRRSGLQLNCAAVSSTGPVDVGPRAGVVLLVMTSLPLQEGL